MSDGGKLALIILVAAFFVFLMIYGSNLEMEHRKNCDNHCGQVKSFLMNDICLCKTEKGWESR